MMNPLIPKICDVWPVFPQSKFLEPINRIPGHRSRAGQLDNAPAIWSSPRGNGHHAEVASYAISVAEEGRLPLKSEIPTEKWSDTSTTGLLNELWM